MSKAILVLGNVIDGLGFRGPFENEEAAVAHAGRVQYEDWTTAKLEEPYPEPMDDTERSPEQLEEKYSPTGDGEHPDWPRNEWIDAVYVEESTILGYWSWVAKKIADQADGNRPR